MRNGLTPPSAIKEMTEMRIADNQFPVLKVPPAVVAGKFNLLPGPAHPRFSEIRITHNPPYSFNPRLLR